MHFGFALDLSDIDLLNVDLLDQRYTHLDLFVSKTSWRRLQDMSSRRLQDMSSRRLQDVFSVTIFRLPRRLGRRKIVTLKTCWKTKNCYAEDVLEDKKLLRWSRVEDVFKTCLEDIFQTSWRPTNVSWVRSLTVWPKQDKVLSSAKLWTETFSMLWKK